MGNDNKENKKDYLEDNKEKKHSTIKVVIISVISTLLIVAIILLLTLLGLKKCSSSNNKSNSNSELPIDTERNNKITDVFIDIVNKQMTFDGYDADTLKSVNVVAYEDNYPSKFNLNIVISSESKVYYYYASDVNYPSDKNGYDNFVSYLLKEDNNRILDGNISLSVLDKADASFNTSKSSYKAVISKDVSDNKYLSGFTYEDSSFFIYQKRLLTEGEDPFTGVGDQKISNDSPLFDYYRGLLAQ